MRITELLLPQGDSDKTLSSKKEKQVDFLKTRMTSYVDKIGDPKTTPKAREFLKTKLQADYNELRKTIESISEDDTKYEVYDSRTKEKVSGPYANLKRASNAAEKKNQEYGAVRYGYRPVKQLNEASPILQRLRDNVLRKTIRSFWD